MGLQPVSETGYIVATEVTFWHLLMRLGGNRLLWWLVIINMMRCNEQQNAHPKHNPTHQLDDAIKYHSHNNQCPKLSKGEILPGIRRTGQGDAEQPCGFFHQLFKVTALVQGGGG